MFQAIWLITLKLRLQGEAETKDELVRARDP